MMLYFIPVADKNISPVPYTAPCAATSGARWIGPGNGQMGFYEKEGHYEQWARITLHGVIIWETSGIDKAEVEMKMRSKMGNISLLAKNNASGTVDLMSTEY